MILAAGGPWVFPAEEKRGVWSVVNLRLWLFSEKPKSLVLVHTVQFFLLFKKQKQYPCPPYPRPELLIHSNATQKRDSWWRHTTERPVPDGALFGSIDANLPPRYHLYKSQAIASDHPPVENTFSLGWKFYHLCSSCVTEHNFGLRTGLKLTFFLQMFTQVHFTKSQTYPMILSLTKKKTKQKKPTTLRLIFEYGLYIKF